mgnify:FL=1
MKFFSSFFVLVFVFVSSDVSASECVDRCQDELEQAQNLFSDVFSSHLSSDSMNDELLADIVNYSDLAGEMFSSSDICYAKQQMENDQIRDCALISERRAWVRKFGRLATFLKAIKFKLSRAECANGCDLSFEHEYFKELSEDLINN